MCADRINIRSCTWCAAAVLCAGVGLVNTQALAQCIEQQNLVAADASANDHYGRTVSISGNVAMVGSFAGDCIGGGNNCGAAYVYRLTGGSWVQTQKLTASDAAVDDQFGRTVFVAGDTAFISAKRDDCGAITDCGSIYVFRFDGSTWNEQQKFTASDPGTEDFFGITIAVSGDVAILGTHRDDCGAGVDCGSAYIFRFNGTSWIEEQKLTASDESANDWFGLSVSLAGDKALIGASQHSCNLGNRCGVVYVFGFNGSTWVEEQKLVPSDAQAGDEFGHVVSANGQGLLIGAKLDDCDAGSDCGSAYVFRFDGASYVQEQKLTPSDASGDDNFGHSASLEGNTAVIGALYRDCTIGNDCGAAYVFDFDGTSWGQRQRITAADAAADDLFGFAVSLSADNILVGARLADCSAGVNCGAAYVFQCFPPGSVPATSTWGLASLTLLLLGVGTVVIRRKTAAFGLG
jgi:type 1 fimbria pilin